MKKVWCIFVVAIVMVTFMLPVFNVKATEGPQNGWVLVDVVDFDCKELVEEYNEENDIYEYQSVYARSNYTLKDTFIAETNNSSNPPMVKGEYLSLHVVYSEIPAIIYPNEPVTLTLSFTAEKNLSYFGWNGVALADFNPPDADPSGGRSGYPAFRNAAGINWFELNKGNNYTAINETLTAQIGAGNEGDRVALRTMLRSGFTMGTNYIYEWKAVDEENLPAIEPPPASSSAGTSEDPEPPTPSRTDVQISVPKNEKGEYKDSGVRFSDLEGEVLIRPGDNRLGWEMAELGMVINVGDVIMTKKGGRCVLSLTDMTTFEMKPESALIMNTESEEESALEILSGKVWANVKRMIKDGSMDHQLSQAVAGIKGTTFVLEEDGTTSTIKVFEGVVEFTPNDGEPISVTNGQMVSVTDGVASEVAAFSITEELSTWSAATAETTQVILAEKGVTLDENGKVINEEEHDTTETISPEGETDYTELFEDKIAEYEQHQKRNNLIKYAVGVLIIGGALGAVFLLRKRNG